MTLPARERRKHKHFRILHMDLRTFWTRFVLGREVPAPPSPAEPVLLPVPQTRVPQAGPLPPFASGIERIDKEHTDLLATIQTLGRAMRNHEGPDAVAQAVTFLEAYTEAHFAFEEAYLKHIAFPGLAAHQQEHTYFRLQIDQLRKRLAAADTTVALELSSLLFRWFQDHILHEDVAYADFARERKARARAR